MRARVHVFGKRALSLILVSALFLPVAFANQALSKTRKPSIAEINEAKKKEAEKRAKAEQKQKEEDLLAKRAEAAKGERKRSGVIAFLASCIAELRRVQWPDRETLIQATAVTLVFVIVAALYLGVLDLAFNWLVQRVI